MNSPLESPDIMQTFIPLSEIGATNTSSIKLSSADSINMRHPHLHQVRPILLQSNYSSSSSTFYQIPNFCLPSSSVAGGSSAGGGGGDVFIENNNSKSLSAIPEVVLESSDCVAAVAVDAIVGRKPTSLRFQPGGESCCRPSLVDFNLNSVGRSFIDDFDDAPGGGGTDSLHTPETPTPNISPSSSNRFSETFSNDFQKAPSSPSIVVSPMQEAAAAAPATVAMYPRIPRAGFCGSWDLLELDLDFHDVNFDPSFGGDLEECIFFGDDPLGLLPPFPTRPDAFDL